MFEPGTLVERWNERWLGDRQALVADLYRPDAVVVSLRAAHPPAVGHEALTSLFRPRHQRVAFPTASTTAVVAAEPTVVVEQLLGGRELDDPGPTAAAALRWWTLDGEGRIARELVWFDWSTRQPAIPDRGGPPAGAEPPGAGAPGGFAAGPGSERTRAWDRSFAARLAETWAWEPELSVRSFFADDCVVVAPAGRDDPVVGPDALSAVVAAQAEQLPARRRELRVLDVAGEGAALAIAFVVESDDRRVGERRASGGAMVAELDGSQRIRTARVYLDWAGARTPAEVRAHVEAAPPA